MSIQNIGANIAKLRKAKGATQEELAKAAGVSAQAVSKWENGGVPDAELFPAIADFFEVTIDALFGREVMAKNVELVLAEKIANTPQEERFELAFELCWVIEAAIFGEKTEEALAQTISEIRKSSNSLNQRYSSIQRDEGYTHMGLGRTNFFFLMPEQEGLLPKILDGVDYCALFRDLGQEDVFRAFILCYKRSPQKSFTEQLLVRELSITEERALEILAIMKKYGHIWTETIELDDRDMRVYKFSPQPYFMGFLLFAYDMIRRPTRFWYNSQHRNKPYLT